MSSSMSLSLPDGEIAAPALALREGDFEYVPMMEVGKESLQRELMAAFVILRKEGARWARVGRLFK